MHFTQANNASARDARNATLTPAFYACAGTTLCALARFVSYGIIDDVGGLHVVDDDGDAG